MGSKSQRCIFCGSDKDISKEHIFPDWLKKYVPPPRVSNDRYVVEVKTLERGEDGQLRYSRKKGKSDRPGAAISQTVRVVCEKCNNGWMSRLQSKAKPILAPLVLGEWGKIGESEREVLATWITMFAMVLDCSEPEHTALTQRQRNEFFRTQKPLPEWIIWMGPMKGEHMTAQAGHRILAVADHSGHVPKPSPTGNHITIAGMGKLAVMAFSTTEKRLWAHVIFEFNPFQILTPIWPRFRGFTNRPTVTISEIHIEALGDMLRKFIYTRNPKP